MNNQNKPITEKTFYCDNEKQWLSKCTKQCTSCYVETIRKIKQ